MLRAILLKREERHCRGQMDSHQVQQGPGVRRGIQILKHTEPFYRSQLLLRLGFLTEGDPECWPTWTCWLRGGWGHSVKVVRSTSRGGVSSGLMVPWWEEHRRVAPQRPPPPYTSCLSEVSFQTFQRPYFWTLFLKAKQCCSSKNRTRLCPFVSRQLFKEPTPHQEPWGSTDHIRLPGGSRLVRGFGPRPQLCFTLVRGWMPSGLPD